MDKSRATEKVVKTTGPAEQRELGQKQLCVPDAAAEGVSFIGTVGHIFITNPIHGTWTILSLQESPENSIVFN